MAITIGHELVHMTHYVLGYRPNGWITNYNFAHNYSEYLAYKWEVYWGGNINYGAKLSPSGYMNMHLKDSGSLLKFLDINIMKRQIIFIVLIFLYQIGYSQEFSLKVYSDTIYASNDYELFNRISIILPKIRTTG